MTTAPTPTTDDTEGSRGEAATVRNRSAETSVPENPPRPLNPLRALRTLGRPPRIMGLDVARGLAVVGMAAAHMADVPDVNWADPATWGGIIHGRSAILFALLAGISTALITGRTSRPEPADMPRLRLRLLGRGAAIFAIGLVLELLHTNIAIILCVYGLLFIAAIPVLRWRPRYLLLGSLVLAIAGPFALSALRVFTLSPHGSGVSLALFGTYPIPVWMAFMLAGLAIGRMRFTATAAATWMVLLGVCLSVFGYAAGEYADDELSASYAVVAGMTPAPAPTDALLPPTDSYWARLAEADPGRQILESSLAVSEHSGGVFEILGSGGFVLAVLGLCLLISRPLRWLLLPIACLGMMPLTTYSAHTVVFWLAAGGPQGVLEPSVALWLWSSVGLAAGATVWAVLLGRGPLERLVAWVARRAEGPVA